MRDINIINQIFTPAKVTLSPVIQAWQRLLVTHHRPPSVLTFGGRTSELDGLMAAQPDTEKPHSPQ